MMSALRFLRKKSDYIKSDTAKEKNRISDECALAMKQKYGEQ